MRFITALADAPLAAFNVIHNEGLKELERNPPVRLGTDPRFSMQVYIQTEEMRAFDDSREFSRIREESRKRMRWAIWNDKMS